MRHDLHDIAQSVHRLVNLRSSDVIVDIGSNDGTLLRQYFTGTRIGFEPAKNIVSKAGPDATIIQDFFNAEEYNRVQTAKARVVTAIAMFYDLQDPNNFLNDVKQILAQDGVFIIQQNYLPSMMERVGFDNIVHEHLEYYTLHSLEHVLERNGLEVFDVELNNVNGGSLRTYISHKGLRSPKPSVDKLREAESGNLDYSRFARRVAIVKEKLRPMLEALKGQSKHVYVLGAGTRGNTILQYCNIDKTIVEGAVDKNMDKWGRETVGGRIPIMARGSAKPDYFLLLPVHFLGEFREQEAEWLRHGGRFILPIPEPRVTS